MKTNRITLTLAVAAVAVAVNLNPAAAEPILSPRAQANRTRIVPGVTENKLDRSTQFRHRHDLAFPPTVKGMGNGRNLVREIRDITVSPRAAASYPHLVTVRRLTGNLSDRR